MRSSARQHEHAAGHHTAVASDAVTLAVLIDDDSAGTVKYERNRYMSYDASNVHDDAKKVIERHLVGDTLRALKVNQGKSLDIGCATGRYPLWFASMGFDAVGFDIDESSIEICQEKSVGKTNVRFEQRNLLDNHSDDDKFDVVTCMMGTWNHIHADQHHRMAGRIREVMNPGGVLFASLWNPDCFYPGFLAFYRRDEREFLLRNSASASDSRRLFRHAGFASVDVLPFAFFPDDCYFAWELNSESLIGLESHMRGKWSQLSRDAQMYLIVART